MTPNFWTVVFVSAITIYVIADYFFLEQILILFYFSVYWVYIKNSIMKMYYCNNNDN